MHRSGCLALHGVNLNKKNPKKVQTQRKLKEATSKSSCSNYDDFEDGLNSSTSRNILLDCFKNELNSCKYKHLETKPDERGKQITDLTKTESFTNIE